MSVWGKIIGGTAGFAIGGPLGAILGVMAGNVYDKSKRKKFNFNHISNQQKQNIFALSVIILSAKIAKSDGVVTKDEISAFKEKFKINNNEIQEVSKIFNEAKKSKFGYEKIAKQVGILFSDNKILLEELLNNLFYIAEADGNVSNSELKMIRQIAQIFGLTEIQFNSIMESRKSSDKLNPYIVLESKPDDTIEIIRKRYLKLSKEHHPDLLMSKGVPQEVIDESKAKMRSINSAWDQVQKLKSN